MPRNASEWLWLATGSIGALVAAIVSYSVAGAIGLGVVALGIGFISIRMDLERGAPVGGDTTETLFASTLATTDARRDERAKLTAADLALSRYLLWGKLIALILGAAAIILGMSPDGDVGPE